MLQEEKLLANTALCKTLAEGELKNVQHEGKGWGRAGEYRCGTGAGGSCGCCVPGHWQQAALCCWLPMELNGKVLLAAVSSSALALTDGLKCRSACLQ